MDEDDGWDWPWIYYLGTVILKMSESEFWRSQPKKIKTLLQIHSQLNSPNEGTTSTTSKRSRSSRLGYIDQVL